MSERVSPRDTDHLVGHEEAEKTFLDAWVSGRLAHAWMICGPHGIGKATLAYVIARFVLSGGGDGGGLFGGGPDTLRVSKDHSVSKMIASGGHPDLKVVERGWSDASQTKQRSEIVVSDVREAGHFLSMTPAMGGWRVVIIDSADDMNRNAANAILKVLEEPPRNALILLVVNSPGRLLPTIRSRCRRLSLKPLPQPVVAELIGRYAPELSPDDAARLGVLAQGSIGEALNLADAGGLELYDEIAKMLDGLPRTPSTAFHAFAERSVADAGWSVIPRLMERWLTDRIRQWATRREVGLESWLGVWEKVRTLFARADAVNLDRKQTVLTALTMVERVAKGS
jgi:DNA polymerase-3 subunit delta'